MCLNYVVILVECFDRRVTPRMAEGPSEHPDHGWFILSRPAAYDCSHFRELSRTDVSTTNAAFGE